MEAVVAPLLQWWVYGAVPPVTAAEADPLLPPKQETLVPLHVAERAAEGWVTV